MLAVSLAFVWSDVSLRLNSLALNHNSGVTKRVSLIGKKSVVGYSRAGCYDREYSMVMFISPIIDRAV